MDKTDITKPYFGCEVRAFIPHSLRETLAIHIPGGFRLPLLTVKAGHMLVYPISVRPVRLPSVADGGAQSGLLMGPTIRGIVNG